MDKVLLCTEAAAPPWLAQSGLALDDDGFVQVDEYLRAPNHPHIFAAGDVASRQQNPVPKAGVYALHQGPALFRNLRATLLEQPLKPYKPRRNFLGLLSCGGQRAIATRQLFTAAGSAPWYWKDHIDRKFMRRFSELPVQVEMRERSSLRALFSPGPQRLEQRNDMSVAGMRCDGSGASVGADILNRALASLPQQQSPALLHGTGDDAAVLQLPAGKVLVQSSEQLRALVADPWLFGRLAALHALSNLFAMRAQPIAAQALVTLPASAPQLCARDLQQLLDGTVRELNQHNCVLSGGHTSEGGDLQLGLTVNGFAEQASHPNNYGVCAGDCLILTKPLGIGALFAAERQGQARDRWLQQALEVMLQSNAAAAEIFCRNHANALTRVSSIGLLGHLLEILQWQPAGISPLGTDSADHAGSANSTGNSRRPLRGASLFADALPILPGAAACAQRGLHSSLHQHNARAYTALQNPTAWQSQPQLPLLIDPQICGGLLASVPAASAEKCLSALHAAGCRHSSIIGFVDELPENSDQLGCAPQPIHLTKTGNWKKMAERYTAVTS